MVVERHPAVGDCERIRPGFLAQPTNSISSLAYAVAGGALCLRARRRDGATPTSTVFGVLVAANAVGGLGFHGPGGRLGHRLHDVALLGTLATMSAQVLAVAPAAPALAPAARRRLVSAAGLLAVASVVKALSGTGGPWCRPDSRVQGHAVWHVLTAAGLYEWGVATARPPAPVRLGAQARSLTPARAGG